MKKRVAPGWFSLNTSLNRLSQKTSSQGKWDSMRCCGVSRLVKWRAGQPRWGWLLRNNQTRTHWRIFLPVAFASAIRQKWLKNCIGERIDFHNLCHCNTEVCSSSIWGWKRKAHRFLTLWKCKQRAAVYSNIPLSFGVVNHSQRSLIAFAFN